MLHLLFRVSVEERVSAVLLHAEAGLFDLRDAVDDDHQVLHLHLRGALGVGQCAVAQLAAGVLQGLELLLQRAYPVCALFEPAL